ncbi:MAG: hypothetical protein HOD43_10030 [Candidatus Marinimicrobia bacterium]|jgi:hypothetical protein|nr:hypothetical protein [Candidatus Neomarinimicrobiota bacterium]MBT3631228.1 hypothetical protein [Candidatus Neomarinimicrobiota bacterium]MBT3824736.1 hypothetical protein [Candidatus Neomarinimicrobiota bacterium]MBT4131660.1 hypothetical protein [Candidatus Neomarinimicrobiota bacterium]MBT4296129.1 hypothetical protein [Candidatus Neomarinimicrobiota bacterium]
MKYLRTVIMMIPLLMVSCLEVETTSKVNPDGSIERSIQLKGSAESILETNFNVPRHDLEFWQISQDSLEEDNYLYLAEAKFESIDDLNQSFRRNAQDPGVQIKASLFINEGFFFTRYFYKEDIWADLGGPELPMESYLTQAELEALISNETEAGAGHLDSVESARIEAGFDDYMQHLIFEDFIIELRKGGKRSGNLSVIDGMIKEHSDSLLKALSSTNFYDENLVWKSVLEKYISRNTIEEVQAGNAEGFVQFYQRWQFFEEVLVDDYNFSIEMPGVIRKTSALDVRGNRMSWEPATIQLFFGGISLEAESSVIKPWSLVMTGLLILLTLVVMVTGLIRQRNRNRAV